MRFNKMGLVALAAAVVLPATVIGQRIDDDFAWTDDKEPSVAATLEASGNSFSASTAGLDTSDSEDSDCILAATTPAVEKVSAKSNGKSASAQQNRGSNLSLTTNCGLTCNCDPTGDGPCEADVDKGKVQSKVTKGGTQGKAKSNFTLKREVLTNGILQTPSDDDLAECTELGALRKKNLKINIKSNGQIKVTMKANSKSVSVVP